MRARWLGVVVSGSLIGGLAHAQDRQALTLPPSVLISAWVGPTSSLRDRVADSVGQVLKRRVDLTNMVVRTRTETLYGGLGGPLTIPTERGDLLELGKLMNADFIVDIDIDDERSAPQLTTLVIERATNAERRLVRIPFRDPAVAVRTLVEMIATDSIMTQRTPLRCGGVYFEFMVDREAELIRSSVRLPPRSPHGEGEVLATFVVDTFGRVAPGTFKSLKATSGAMLREVMDDVPNWRFTPATSRPCGLVSQSVMLPIQR